MLVLSVSVDNTIREHQLDELEDQGNYESVDGDSLSESDCEDHRGLNFASSLRIAADGFHTFATDLTDGKRRHDGADGDGASDGEDPDYFYVHF